MMSNLIPLLQPGESEKSVNLYDICSIERGHRMTTLTRSGHRLTYNGSVLVKIVGKSARS